MRAELLGRSSLDLLLVSALTNQPAAAQDPDGAALCSWVGRKLGLGEPLAAATGQQAIQVLDSLLKTQAFGEKELPLDLDAQLARLLLALNQVKSAYARLRGDSRLALAAHSLSNQLERRCSQTTRPEPAPSASPSLPTAPPSGSAGLGRADPTAAAAVPPPPAEARERASLACV